MKKNLTEIVIVCDRSGSMQSIKSDMEGALKSFLATQKEVKGECRVTYYRFDTEIERVFENLDIHDVKDIEIRPRSMTALIDACCVAIDEVGARLSKTKESQKPSKVIYLIISDGFENASKEFKKEDLAKKIKHQESKYSWDFVYLGANQDAFSVGRDYGFQAGNSVSYNTSSRGITNAVDTLSCKVASYRVSDDKSALSFSDSERADAML